MNKNERQAIIRKVTWVGGCIDAVLAFLKMLVGWLVHSPALIADGFHSLSDLLTDVAVVVFPLVPKLIQMKSIHMGTTAMQP